MRNTPITVTLLTVLARVLDVGVAAAACGRYPAGKVREFQIVGNLLAQWLRQTIHLTAQYPRLTTTITTPHAHTV